MLSLPVLLLALAPLARAHFKIEYPPWRADSLDNSNYSQYTFPCAGVPEGNRTDWPLAGGSLQLNLHHKWSYLFVNLGLGDNVTNFNYSLTAPTFWNESGSGVLCISQLALPAGLETLADGQRATLQVVSVGSSGSALYNCADITFRAGDLAAFGGQNCTTDAGISYASVAGHDANDTASASSTAASSSTAAAATSSSTATTSGAVARAAGASTSVFFLTVLSAAGALALGMSL